MDKKLFFFLILSLFLNPLHSKEPVSSLEKFKSLKHSLSRSLDTKDKTDKKRPLFYQHVFDHYDEKTSMIIFKDGFSFKINWWYTNIPKKWKEGDQIFVTIDFSSGSYKIEHAVTKEIAWGSLKSLPTSLPTITRIRNGLDDPSYGSLISLSNSFTFRSVEPKAFQVNGWNVKDKIILFRNSETLYQLFNANKEQFLTAHSEIKELEEESIKINIFEMEKNLNAQVLQQKNAVNAVYSSFLNYTAGFQDKDKPIGVFLFLGPTGVGKTELAKALNQEIYGKSDSLVRFDMSHFSGEYNMTRLIGTPPGYAYHEEGGQLTNSLQESPKKIVLLDEIEKAHDKIRKAFLPIFDEGYILNSRNEKIECKETVFIMTSNLCGPEIAELHKQGYSSDEILEVIEPELMAKLSPELYARVEPVIFEPLEKKSMLSLVELLLNRTKKQLLSEKKISLFFDDSLKEFLAEEGFHPLLGARPLKKLIEKTVIKAVAYKIVKEKIKENTELFVSYDFGSSSVEVEVLEMEATPSEDTP